MNPVRAHPAPQYSPCARLYCTCSLESVFSCLIVSPSLSAAGASLMEIRRFSLYTDDTKWIPA
uniref:Uncharacterized protein n=1 Tax=Faecalibaculum rodentium TaxID=1702221 RepID=A0A140DVL8_9FIRM|nr:hypothetical protein AALO17_15610 [Faecalibaculum rodentium]